nr:MAG: nonstructural protein [Microvirus sp.]
MKLDIFSVFDAKAKTFCTPFFSSNISTATRAFAHAANDKTTDIGRYPSDFTLYHIGTFNDSDCEFDLVPPHPIAIAVTLLDPQEPSHV